MSGCRKATSAPSLVTNSSSSPTSSEAVSSQRAGASGSRIRRSRAGCRRWRTTTRPGRRGRAGHRRARAAGHGPPPRVGRSAAGRRGQRRPLRCPQRSAPPAASRSARHPAGGQQTRAYPGMPGRPSGRRRPNRAAGGHRLGLRFDTSRGEHPHPGRPPAGIRQQRALAHARFAAHHQPAAAPVTGPLQEGADRRLLCLLPRSMDPSQRRTAVPLIRSSRAASSLTADGRPQDRRFH